LPDDPYTVGIIQGSRTCQCRRRLDQLPDFLALGRFLCLNLHVAHSLPDPGALRIREKGSPMVPDVALDDAKRK
jgi:hypothetical protein